MNSIELNQKLNAMASEHGIYNPVIYSGIITAIMNRYMTTRGFYEEQAITTFQRFLSAGILEF